MLSNHRSFSLHLAALGFLQAPVLFLVGALVALVVSRFLHLDINGTVVGRLAGSLISDTGLAVLLVWSVVMDLAVMTYLALRINGIEKHDFAP